MLVGFGAGGGTDIAARIMAQKMSEILGQSIVVENRTGASGMIAAEDEAKSAPDGYTLMMGSQTTYAVAPNLYRKVTLDPAKDFAGVAMTGASPLVLVVNPSFAAHSVKDVIAMAKADPGKINFGTGGLGTTPHMTAELFQYIAGIKMVHVAYRGEAPAHQRSARRTNSADVRQPLGRDGQPQGRHGARARGHRRAALAVGARHSDGGGDGAARFRGGNLVGHRGAGRNAAQPDLDKLNAAARKALAGDDTKKRYADLGMTNGGSSPEELDAYIKSEIAKWSKVIEDANIQPMD